MWWWENVFSVSVCERKEKNGLGYLTLGSLILSQHLSLCFCRLILHFSSVIGMLMSPSVNVLPCIPQKLSLGNRGEEAVLFAAWLLCTFPFREMHH